MPPDRPSRRLDRSQLPEEFTPETVRGMGMRTARQLADPRNGVLSPVEQRSFDEALREVLEESANRLGRSFTRDRPSGTMELDPDLRRSYQRTQRRLDAQAARARWAFPQLADDWTEKPPAATVDEPVDEPVEEPLDEPDAGEDVSVGEFEAEVTQTTDMMDILEQIAGIQQQQLEHQRSQLLSETRGLFFALAVSVAVIVAGIAPLVEASPHERRLILLWTAVVCILGGCAYAAIRALQSRSD